MLLGSAALTIQFEVGSSGCGSEFRVKDKVQVMLRSQIII
jgi:hypothetical protein